MDFYMSSSDWMKNNKATINPRNHDDKCFQYPVTAALTHQNIKIHVERISKIMPYNWKEISFLSHKKDRKKFESNDQLIAVELHHIIMVIIIVLTVFIYLEKKVNLISMKMSVIIFTQKCLKAITY